MPNDTQQPQAPTPPPVAPQPPQPSVTPPQPGVPNPYGQPPKKNTGLIIGIIIGAILLIGGGVALALTLSNSGDKKEDSSKQTSKDSSDNTTKKDTEEVPANDDALRAANAKTAGSLTDFKAVCEVGSVSNAADLAKPYKVVAFSKEDNGRDYWSQTSLKYGAPYYVEYNKFEQANVVVCLSETISSRVKAKTCDFKSGEDNLTIDYYATAFSATAYEAKTGKKLQDLGTINAPASTCPMFASYDKNDPKIIANPDATALDAAVAKFAS